MFGVCVKSRGMSGVCVKSHGGNGVEYCGKSLDGFEYAFSSLLRANGVDVERLPSLDCLSFRSFAFSGSGSVRDWFRPVAEWRFYVPMLAANLGCTDTLELQSAPDASPNAFRVWTLAGEVPYPGQRVTVRSTFYSGTPPFFLCKRILEGELMICDPLDGSCDLVAEDALYTALKRSDGYLASFHQPPDIHTASAEAVLDRALAWRATGGVGVAAEDFPFVERWHGGPREQISLRYGLMNGAVQMSKTVRFFTDAGLLGRPAAERLTQMLMDVPDIWKNGRFALLHQLDETLWTALRKGW
jgi:hypothetical protein